MRIGFGLFFLVMGCILAGSGLLGVVPEAFDARDLSQFGETIEGTLTEKLDPGTGSLRRSGPSYLVRYEFTIDDEIYAGLANVGRGDHNRLEKGDTVLIRYLPSDPTNSDFDDKVGNFWGLLIGAFLFCLGGLFFGYLGVALLFNLGGND